MIFDSFWASFCADIPSFSALHKCYIFYKLKVRLSTSKTHDLVYYDASFIVVSLRWGSNFVLLHVAVQLSQHQL